MKELVLTIGIPASGKSTYIENTLPYKNYTIISSDKIRGELYGDERTQGRAGDVFNLVQSRALKALKNGESVVIDATNLSRRHRVAFLKQVPLDVHRVALVFCIPYNNCVKANSERDRVVPEQVMFRMYKQFEPPHRVEGFNKIVYIAEGSEDWEALDEMMEMNCATPHDNHHHTLSCGDHCLETEKLMDEALKQDYNHDINQYWRFVLPIAARYHDLGKYRVKVFENYAGEPTDEAHYYNHANVSAYDFLCGAVIELYNGKTKGYCSSEFLQDTSCLISNHMIQFESPRTAEKIAQLYGEEFMRYLMILHDCDFAAH